MKTVVFMLWFVICLISCKKAHIDSGHYTSAYGEFNITTDSIYFQSSHGIGQNPLLRGVYQLNCKQIHIFLYTPLNLKYLSYQNNCFVSRINNYECFSRDSIEVNINLLKPTNQYTLAYIWVSDSLNCSKKYYSRMIRSNEEEISFKLPFLNNQKYFIKLLSSLQCTKLTKLHIPSDSCVYISTFLLPNKKVEIKPYQKMRIRWNTQKQSWYLGKGSLISFLQKVK